MYLKLFNSIYKHDNYEYYKISIANKNEIYLRDKR